MGRIKRAITRAQYAAMGAAVGAGLGGLISRSAASTGGATGALVGALVGEFRARAAEEGGVTDRLTPGGDTEEEPDDPGAAIEETIRQRIEGRLPDRE
jgi:osmotically inducible lipoprotein OsmB